MRIHYVQHVPYERIGSIEDWATSRGHQTTGTHMYDEPSGAGALPAPEGFDFLVVMGGPMNIYEHHAHPWLAAEKRFIQASIDAGKMVLGICLGGQLLADVLGGTVTRAPFEEIGWLEVELTEAGRRQDVFASFPERFTTLQWHGDMFSIPPGAVHVASSAGTPNQAFCYDRGRVIGLQFHLEETRQTLGELVAVARASGEVCATPDKPLGPYISPLDDLLAPAAPFDACASLLFGMLDRMATR